MDKERSIHLHQLPIEIIYRIFDELSDMELLLSMQSVCVRINSILDKYSRYKVII